MNSFKDKRSLEKSGHSPVKKGHSSKRLLKSHVEKNYFKGMSRNANEEKTEVLVHREEYNKNKFVYSPPSTYLEMPDLSISIVTSSNDRVADVRDVSKTYIQYHTPLFSARAFLEIPALPKGTDIQIGWIQVVTKAFSAMFHGEETVYSWEIPELISGKYSMYLDSDKNSMPWYNIDIGVVTRRGPTRPCTVMIELDDTPSGATTWCEPIAGKKSKQTLTYIHRRQHFLSYLVIKNMKKDTYEIIKCLKWNCEVSIELDPKGKSGERVGFIGPCSNEKPKFLSMEDTPPLAFNVFRPFVANDCMLLAKRSMNKESIIAKEPLHSTVNLSTYIDKTENFTYDLFKVSKSNFLLNYKGNYE